MSVIAFGIAYNTGKMGLPTIQIDLIFSVAIGGLSSFTLIFYINNTKRKNLYLLIFVILLASAGVLVLLRKFAGDMNNE